MNTERTKKIEKIATKTTASGLLLFLILTAAVMTVALFATDTSDEAPIGSFDVIDFNEGWGVMLHGQKQIVTLPAKIDCDKGDELILSNVLPDDIVDGMSMMTRASTVDIAVYIGGRLRVDYSTSSVKGMGK